MLIKILFFCNAHTLIVWANLWGNQNFLTFSE